MNDLFTDVTASLGALAANRANRWKLAACGVTPGLQGIPALLDRDAYLPASSRIRVLLISGLSGGANDVALAMRALELFQREGDRLADRIALTAVPMANPQASNGMSSGYPPVDNFFNDPQEPEKRYLWRWICFQAPSLVLELRAGESSRWQANDAAAVLASALSGATDAVEDGCLLAALGTGTPDGLGPIPGLRLTCSLDSLTDELAILWDAVSAHAGSLAKSPARRALNERHDRSYLEVAGTLASVYGYQLDPVNYTQGVGISGRLRLARLRQHDESPAPSIAQLVEPYVSGSVAMFGERAGGANLAGLIWGEELSEATGDRRYAGLIVNVADRYQPGADDGAPPPCDPDFRTEDMFMAGAMLGRAFSITGQERYLDLLVKFLLDSRIQQDNGLFWHCRSAPYLWGRGNGFAALGLTETLTYLPESHRDRDALLDMYRKLMDGLGQVQELSGMIPQILDFPGSYHEFTATCMAGYALARGLGRGWLDPSYRAVLDRTWQGVSERIDGEGNVVDGCASTGVQENLKDYLDRPAIFGFDDRSGGMALWFAVEMERLARGTGGG
ncbi:MAG: glycoside hydrolase family 88 protein [Chloroflexi bacterium]|nr:glycoside hydrolase family 88 protein [Chloroflexota bacterium]